MLVAPLFRLLEDDEVELVEDDNPAYVMLVTGRFDPVTNWLLFGIELSFRLCKDIIISRTFVK